MVLLLGHIGTFQMLEREKVGQQQIPQKEVLN